MKKLLFLAGFFLVVPWALDALGHSFYISFASRVIVECSPRITLLPMRSEMPRRPKLYA